MFLAVSRRITIRANMCNPNGPYIISVMPAWPAAWLFLLPTPSMLLPHPQHEHEELHSLRAMDSFTAMDASIPCPDCSTDSLPPSHLSLPRDAMRRLEAWTSSHSKPSHSWSVRLRLACEGNSPCFAPSISRIEPFLKMLPVRSSVNVGIGA